MARILNLADQQVQTMSKLIAVSLMASLITAVLILAFILPVCYQVDPLGLGAKLGVISNPANSEAMAAAPNSSPLTQPIAQPGNPAQVAPSVAVAQEDDPLSVRQDTVELTIPPKQSLDYRLAMERDYDLDYHWTANGKTVYMELRGEPKDGKAPSKTFAKLTSATGRGFFIIPFNGQFGWHWQNKSNQPVTIRLHTKGHYQVVGQLGPIPLG